MKRIFTFLTIMMFAFTMNAQYIYNDFDANQNETFNGWSNMPTVIANPDASGINTSANVAEWVRGEEQYAHVYCEIDGTVDFSTGTVFALKAYLPIACDVLFKLEGSNGEVTELITSVTTVNEWTQLSFDFVDGQSGIYNKIVIFFDFATFANNTYYFDDVTGPNYESGGTGNQVDLPVTFDDDDIDYGLTDFGGNISEIIIDPTNPDNKVAQSIKTEAAETWAGTTVGGTVGFISPIPFAEGSTTMTVLVYSPTSGTPIRLKVEDAGDPTITVETEATTTVAQEWETLSFDFSNEAAGTAAINFANTYNKASIFFNFGTDGATAGEQTYLWDDMEFVGGSGPKPLLALDVQDNFENDGWSTINDWMFQDPDLAPLVIVADPVDPTNHVADYNRSGSFEWTNAQAILDHRMDLSTRNIFSMDVFLPSTNDYSGDLTPTAAIKLQNSLLGGNAWTTQTEIKLDVTVFDEWVTLNFDFSAVSDSVNYDQLVIQFGGEGHWVPGLFYFDNLLLQNPTAIAETSIESITIYPNPATDIINIVSSDKLLEVSIYSVTGQLMYSSENIGVVDVSNYTAGLYIVSAIYENGTRTESKIMIK